MRLISTAFVIMVCLLIAKPSSAQSNKRVIRDFIGQRIEIQDRFAGQSITLMKEGEEYYILREFESSGVPSISPIKYQVVFDNNYRISFSEALESSERKPAAQEHFVLMLEKNRLRLYLNGLRVVIIKKHF